MGENQIIVDMLDFPPCMDLANRLNDIQGARWDPLSMPQRMILDEDTDSNEIQEKLVMAQKLSIMDYSTPGIYRCPAALEEFAYNLHILLNVTGVMGISNLEKRYNEHFGHNIPFDDFLPPNTSVSEGLEMVDIVIVNMKPGEEATIQAKYPQERTFRMLVEQFYRDPPPLKFSLQDGQAPPSKKRKIAHQVGQEQIEGALKTLHATLIECVGDEDYDIEVPLRVLQNRYETKWKIRFDSEVFGSSSFLQFLRKFPKVFQVQNDGIEMTARALSNPDFSSPPETVPQTKPGRAFVLGAAHRLVGLCVNNAAEMVPQNADFDEKYASYECVQKLIDIYIEGKDAIETSAAEVTNDVAKPDPDKIVHTTHKQRMQRGF